MATLAQNLFVKTTSMLAAFAVLTGCQYLERLKEDSPAASASATSAPSATGSATTVAATSASAEPRAAVSAETKGAPPADSSRLKLKGRAIQGGLMHAQIEKGAKKIKFPGHRVIIGEDGTFLVGFHRTAPKQEKLTVTFGDGQELEHTFDVEQRTYEIDKIDGLPKHMVELDLQTRKKLHEANNRIEAARKKFSNKACYNDGFVWPVHGKITSRYGQPRVMNGIDTGIHWGIDVAAIVGTPVKAPACGTVIFAEHNVPLSGHLLVLDHGHGLSSSFLHLHSFAVKVGAEVKQGDIIGRVGMTGRTNGAHLDWRMNLFEARIDPELLVPPLEQPGQPPTAPAASAPK
jgi:murein DD-endopeptidase MepM/ murein hydrolase activator NlpD